jgi:predicted alpha/beta-fold hydrolase
MQQRLVATGRYTAAELARWKTVYAMDDHVTAPSFGFGNAENYYATQSSKNFLDAIRVPTLLIQAKDDTFIPFKIFDHPAFRTNPYLRLEATEHGGHLGFLARRGQRFWVDDAAIEFLRGLVRAPARTLTSR